MIALLKWQRPLPAAELPCPLLGMMATVVKRLTVWFHEAKDVLAKLWQQTPLPLLLSPSVSLRKFLCLCSLPLLLLSLCPFPPTPLPVPPHSHPFFHHWLFYKGNIVVQKDETCFHRQKFINRRKNSNAWSYQSFTNIQLNSPIYSMI